MTPSDLGYELLGWDSGVFGFPVARVPATEDPRALTDALDAARHANVRLVYVQTEKSEATRVARALGGHPISERVTFVREVTAEDADTSSRTDHQPTVELWPGSPPTRELLQLARDAGRFSRFRVDPKVPVEVFERIYDAWITRSASGQLAAQVMVTRSPSSLTGLVTVGEKDGRAEIGLLAVREEARGEGLGRALVRAALAWAARRRLGTAQVITQHANVAACRLYQSCGYSIERIENVFHFWL